MAVTEEDSYHKQREYSRVEVYIPIEFRILTLEERAKVKSRISGETALAGFKMLPKIEDPFTVEWLTILNNKLDTIIRMLAFDHEGFYSLPYMTVNIGGGGMSFSTRDSYTIGDVLEIKMMISTPRPLALYVYAEVIHIEERQETFTVCTHFIMMDDIIRDEIIRFVFEKEREFLREKRGGGL